MLRASGDRPASGNTGNSGVFTATVVTARVGPSEGASRTAGQPPVPSASIRGMYTVSPPIPAVRRVRPLARCGPRLGYINGRRGGEGRFLEFNEGAVKI